MVRVYILLFFLLGSISRSYAAGSKWWLNSADTDTTHLINIINDNFNDLANKVDSNKAQSLINYDKKMGRWLGGWVSASGTTLSGSGFTSSTSGTGVYTVTYNTVFSVTPFVNTTAFSVGSSSDCQASLVSVSPGAFTVDTLRIQSGTLINTSFYFTVFGGR